MYHIIHKLRIASDNAIDIAFVSMFEKNVL